MWEKERRTKVGPWLISSGLARFRLTVYTDAVAESGRNRKHHIDDSAGLWRMSGLTRDGTTEPVSRDQIFRREWGQ